MNLISFKILEFWENCWFSFISKQATTRWSEDQIRLYWRSTISFTKKGKKDHTFRLFEVGLTWKSSVTMKDPDSLPCQHHFMVTWAGASIWTTNYVFLLSQLNPFFGMMPFPRKSHFFNKILFEQHMTNHHSLDFFKSLSLQFSHTKGQIRTVNMPINS